MAWGPSAGKVYAFTMLDRRVGDVLRCSAHAGGQRCNPVGLGGFVEGAECRHGILFRTPGGCNSASGSSTMRRLGRIPRRALLNKIEEENTGPLGRCSCAIAGARKWVTEVPDS